MMNDNDDDNDNYDDNKNSLGKSLGYLLFSLTMRQMLFILSLRLCSFACLYLI